MVGTELIPAMVGKELEGREEKLCDGMTAKVVKRSLLCDAVTGLIKRKICKLLRLKRFLQRWRCVSREERENAYERFVLAGK